MNTQSECVSRGNLTPFISRKLGQNVGLKLSRSHRTDPQARLKDDWETLVNEQVLRCVLDVPHAATDIEVVANLAKRTISCSMKLGAPQRQETHIGAGQLAETTIHQGRNQRRVRESLPYW